MHCFVVNICMNIKCMHEEIRCLFLAANLSGDQMFWSELQLPFHVQKKEKCNHSVCES